MKFILKIIAIPVFSCTILSNLYSQDDSKLFRDSLDGAFDISKWLFDLHGFLPVISPITEPAVGYGLVGAGIYFIPKKKPSDGKFRMPDIAGIGGGYTQNGTWFAGGGYAGFWKDDQIRYRGVFGYGDINLKYYGSGNEYLAINPAKYSIEAYFLLQQALIRVKKSPFFRIHGCFP